MADKWKRSTAISPRDWPFLGVTKRRWVRSTTRSSGLWALFAKCLANSFYVSSNLLIHEARSYEKGPMACAFGSFINSSPPLLRPSLADQRKWQWPRSSFLLIALSPHPVLSPIACSLLIHFLRLCVLPKSEHLRRRSHRYFFIPSLHLATAHSSTSPSPCILSFRRLCFEEKK